MTMNYRFFLLLLPVACFVGCETTASTMKTSTTLRASHSVKTAPVKRNFISSYKGMAKEEGLLNGGALVRKADPKTLTKYTKVMVEDVRVIPARTSSGKEKTATRAESKILADQFESALRKELGQHYELTSRRGANTLTVRAALTELRPSNPALFALNYAPYVGIAMTGVKLATGKTPGSGSTSFEAEVLDSLSRRQIYAIVDHSQGSKIQFTGLDKWGHSGSAMRLWSRKIRTGIQAKAR